MLQCSPINIIIYFLYIIYNSVTVYGSRIIPVHFWPVCLLTTSSLAVKLLPVPVMTSPEGSGHLSSNRKNRWDDRGIHASPGCYFSVYYNHSESKQASVQVGGTAIHALRRPLTRHGHWLTLQLLASHSMTRAPPTACTTAWQQHQPPLACLGPCQTIY